MSSQFYRGAFELALCLCPLLVRADIIAASTFDTGSENWSLDSNAPLNFSWQPSGGNLGGYVQFTDNINPGSDFVAPSKFLGNWRQLRATSLSFDHRVIDTGSTVISSGPYAVFLSGPGGRAVWTGYQNLPFTPGPWVNNQISISPEIWTVTSGTWDALLIDVQSLIIRGEIYRNTDVTPPEVIGLDNVVLTGSPVPEPMTLTGLATGLLCLVRRRRQSRSKSC